jgi:hypothetical protein
VSPQSSSGSAVISSSTDAEASSGSAVISSSTDAELVPGTAITSITQPEIAVTALKQRVSLLHKVVNDVGNFSSLAFNDVESLVSEISYLSNFIRSKV